MNPLGRRVPQDWEHVEKWPLSSAAAVALPPTPAVIGVNWYPAFDEPYKGTDGYYYVRMPPAGQNPRGGHCVAVKALHLGDNGTAWWDFYNQGTEGACVGFGCSRVMSMMNRKRYDARWLWNQAKRIDEWPDTNPGDDNGTSVRAGLDVLKRSGHVVYRAKNQPDFPNRAEGISAYRWIRSIDDLQEVVGYQQYGFVDIVNSWGRNYPHFVRFPLEVVERLWREDGEVGVVTDR